MELRQETHVKLLYISTTALICTGWVQSTLRFFAQSICAKQCAVYKHGTVGKNLRSCDSDPGRLCVEREANLCVVPTPNIKLFLFRFSTKPFQGNSKPSKRLHNFAIRDQPTTASYPHSLNLA